MVLVLIFGGMNTIETLRHFLYARANFSFGKIPKGTFSRELY